MATITEVRFPAKPNRRPMVVASRAFDVQADAADTDVVLAHGYQFTDTAEARALLRVFITPIVSRAAYASQWIVTAAGTDATNVTIQKLAGVGGHAQPQVRVVIEKMAPPTIGDW
jgi:hypothetical protein